VHKKASHLEQCFLAGLLSQYLHCFGGVSLFLKASMTSLRVKLRGSWLGSVMPWQEERQRGHVMVERVQGMHRTQKVWPQGNTRGSLKKSKQTVHSSE